MSVARGHLTHGPEAGALVNRTIDFVHAELPRWRDRRGRVPVNDEELLNAQLNRHLNVRARELNFPVHFQHEEKQTARRRVDIAATPAYFAGAFVGSTFHGIDDPFLVFEGKRLPPPGGRARKREYVTGEPALTGGIQRFKLGLHGAKLPSAVLIGYVQAESVELWHRRINTWVRALARRRKLSGRESWMATEQLTPLVHSGDRTALCASNHLRISSISGEIRLHHIWVEMIDTCGAICE